MSTDADHDWLDKSVDAPTVPVGCHRSHPHENMDSTCERFTQYERELASLRAEKERAKAERDEAIRMRDRHAEASKAQNEDITALMAERDAALKDAERYRFIRAGKSGTYNTILIHAGSQLDAAIDAARKGEQ